MNAAKPSTLAMALVSSLEMFTLTLQLEIDWDLIEDNGDDEWEEEAERPGLKIVANGDDHNAPEKGSVGEAGEDDDEEPDEDERPEDETTLEDDTPEDENPDDDEDLVEDEDDDDTSAQETLTKTVNIVVPAGLSMVDLLKHIDGNREQLLQALDIPTEVVLDMQIMGCILTDTPVTILEDTSEE